MNFVQDVLTLLLGVSGQSTIAHASRIASRFRLRRRYLNIASARDGVFSQVFPPHFQFSSAATMSTSLSTTTTSTFTLTKFSRSYPNASVPQQGDQWQHFTNQGIRLLLDIKKKSSGELESYRVRVVWFLDSGSQAENCEVTFVSLVDYLMFHAS